MRTRIVIVLVGFVAAVTLITVLVFGGSPNTTINRKISVPGSFANTVTAGDGTVIFTNGRALVRYNVHSGKTSLLTADTAPSGLTNLNSLSFSAGYTHAVFRAANPVEGSPLYNQLNQAGVDTTASYWWNYSSATHAFTLLPENQSTVLAKYSGGKLFALVNNSSGDQLVGYNPDTLQVESTVNTPLIGNFFVTPYGYLLNTASGQLLLTKDGTVSQTLGQSINVTGVIGSTYAVGLVNHNGSQNLVVINLQTQAVKTLATGVSGMPALLPDGTVLYAQEQSSSSATMSYYTKNVRTGKRAAWDTSSINTNDLTPVALIDSTSAIVSDPSGHYYLIGSNLTPITEPSSTYHVSLAGGSVVIQATDTPGTVAAALNDPDNVAAGQAAVYATLHQLGYNPQLLTVLFSVGSPGSNTD